MHYVDVQGARVPALGLGTWRLSGSSCRDIVSRAIELGYRHIDTAQAYGNEGEVGAGLRASGVDRDEVWLTTKVALSNMHFTDAVESAQDSVKRLGSEYVDLLLVHWPNPNVPFDETFAALEKLKEEGLVRHIGVSNFTLSMLESALSTTALLGIQVECHPLLPQRRLLSFAVGRDLLFTAYSPLARGNVVDEPTLCEIAQYHGKTAAQVALRWLLQRRNTAAIPKASSVDHLRENFEVFDFELSSDQVRRIDALGEDSRRFVDPSFAPQWETR